MTTKKKSKAIQHLEKISGGPLTLGRLIEAIRLGDEISQQTFAKKLGISPSHLCDIEKQRKVVSPERAVKFARILKYSEQQFLRLALQGMLDQAGIPFTVEIKTS
jgi:transcriptional regulator with XRE-family HTH domain